MDISIIIPCYNHGTYLLEALNALAELKTEFEYEVIVVDDGSTDSETLCILDQLRHLGKYNIIHQLNQGVGVARNTGISASSGQFIIPLDADNMLVSANWPACIAHLRANPRGAVAYGDAQFFGSQDGVWVNSPLDITKMVTDNQIDNCVIIRRSALADVGGYNTNKAFQSHADWLLWLSLLTKGWQFHYQPGVFFRYRVVADSMLRTDGAAMQKVSRIALYAYPIQRQVLDRAVAGLQLGNKEATSTLGKIESRLAYYQLLYGSLTYGLSTLFSSFAHVPRMSFVNIRILVFSPIKRIYFSIFK